jgi:hypothetical protein
MLLTSFAYRPEITGMFNSNDPWNSNRDPVSLQSWPRLAKVYCR